nr:immunoglobulin light chain junction region [Mus musculus]NSL97094.1 immunoglobulin light chain junction region [Mus musculus]NSL97203.1 immunoglobulin light chain junction region [Mus musculus]NSL97354.1 immunoglobulin light chain junction region [Mus musculus]NSL97520.1 immunoglobulin light chain junction region [Mus musculus]
CQQWSSYPLTF